MNNVRFEQDPDGTHVAILVGGVSIGGAGATREEALDRLVGYLNELHQRYV